MDALHGAFPHLARSAPGLPVHADLEARIEQGPVLEREHLVIGIVTGIQGRTTWEVQTDGAEGHGDRAGFGLLRQRVLQAA